MDLTLVGGDIDCILGACMVIIDLIFVKGSINGGLCLYMLIMDSILVGGDIDCFLGVCMIIIHLILVKESINCSLGYYYAVASTYFTSRQTQIL